jgi:uncharacterized membrane protein YgcG
MEILIMIAIGAATLGLIWLIVREPVQIMHREARISKELFTPRPEPTLSQFKVEMEQEVRVNAGIPRMPPVKPTRKESVDTKPAKKYSGSTSGSSSSRSSRSSDDGYSSYSSWGGDSGSSSSSCDSSSSSSSSSSCD